MHQIKLQFGLKQIHGYNFTRVTTRLYRTLVTIPLLLLGWWSFKSYTLHVVPVPTLVTCNHVTVSFRHLTAAEKFDLHKRKVILAMRGCPGQWEWLHFLLLKAFDKVLSHLRLVKCQSRYICFSSPSSCSSLLFSGSM